MLQLEGCIGAMGNEMTRLEVGRIASDAWGLTPEERARLAAAPFASTPEDWRWSGASIHEKALEGYAAGEMDFRRLLEVTRAGSLGCSLNDRIRLTALTVERGLRIRPKSLHRQRPQYPHWLREAAGDLVGMLVERNPGKAVAPCDDQVANVTREIGYR